MRRLLTAALMLLAATPAVAAPQTLDPQARQAAAAQSCRETCRAQAARSGAPPAAAQACFIRCGGGPAVIMARQEVRSAAPAFTGVGIPVQASAAPQGSYGVIFAARAPSGAHSLVIEAGDRLQTHRTAEQRCASNGPGCRMIAEFAQACGAVAQGVRRATGALFMTSDPNTYVVTSTGAGSAGTRLAAEADAMAECRSRDPQGSCRIVAAQCAPRN